MARHQRPWTVRGAVAVAASALLGFATAPRATAADWDRHAGERLGGVSRGHELPHWGHGDIGRFQDGDFARWRSGRWFHGRHAGRLGWWWIVGGAWYFYPAPIYPYPDPYVPPTVVAPKSPPESYWYYCASAKGYYPYVAQCPEGWMQVVPRATPPGQ